MPSTDRANTKRIGILDVRWPIRVRVHRAVNDRNFHRSVVDNIIEHVYNVSHHRFRLSASPTSRRALIYPSIARMRAPRDFSRSTVTRLRWLRKQPDDCLGSFERRGVLSEILTLINARARKPRGERGKVDGIRKRVIPCKSRPRR